jgi:hypothetical protein
MTKPTDLTRDKLMPTNPHIAARLKEKAEKIRNQHSTFWMGNDIQDLARSVDAGSIDYIERLRKVQRGVGNFVKIVTGKEIPVIYSSGEQSYTDGKVVVISANIDPSQLDAMCGTALHEATHVAESNESLLFLPEMHRHFELMVSGTEIANLAGKLGIPMRPQAVPINGQGQPAMTQAPGHSVLEHVQMVMKFWKTVVLTCGSTRTRRGIVRTMTRCMTSTGTLRRLMPPCSRRSIGSRPSKTTFCSSST